MAFPFELSDVCAEVRKGSSQAEPNPEEGVLDSRLLEDARGEGGCREYPNKGRGERRPKSDQRAEESGDGGGERVWGVPSGKKAVELED